MSLQRSYLRGHIPALAGVYTRLGVKPPSPSPLLPGLLALVGLFHHGKLLGHVQGDDVFYGVDICFFGFNRIIKANKINTFLKFILLYPISFINTLWISLDSIPR